MVATETASPIRGSTALRAGFAATASQWLWLVALFAVQTVGPLFDLFSWLFALTWILRRQTGIALGIFLLVVSLGVELLRWLVIGSAVYERAHDLPIGQGLLPSCRRSLTALLWIWIIHTLAKILIWLSLISSVAVYLSAWDHPFFRALPASAVLAGSLTGLFPVAIISSLWTELAFVESLKLDQSYLISLSTAAGTLVRRIWAVAGIYLFTALLVWTAEVVTAGIANGIAARGRGFDVALAGAGQIISAVLAALVAAFLELARFQAFSVIEPLPNRGAVVAYPPSPAGGGGSGEGRSNL